MRTLYELANDYKFLENTAEAGESSLTDDELQATLDSLSVTIDDKVENIAKFVLGLRADTASIKSEEERLAGRRKAIDNRIEWLKVYLLREMLRVGKESVKRDVVTVFVKTNPPSVNVIDEEAIPAEFRRIIPETWQPDKLQIINHFKDTGEIIAGTEIIYNKKSVTIR